MITEVGAGVLSAMAFWDMNSMYNCSNIDCCTKIINYNTDTYDERKTFYQQIAAIPAAGN
jgi:predicted chitinase